MLTFLVAGYTPFKQAGKALIWAIAFTENFGFKAPSFARRLFLLVYVNIKTVNIKNK